MIPQPPPSTTTLSSPPLVLSDLDDRVEADMEDAATDGRTKELAATKTQSFYDRRQQSSFVLKIGSV